jgi:hypothetical protein
MGILRIYLLPRIFSGFWILPIINFLSWRLINLISLTFGQDHASEWISYVEEIQNAIEKFAGKKSLTNLNKDSKIEFLTVLKEPIKEQQLLTNLPNLEVSSVIKKEAELMSSSIVKTLHFKQSEQFPITEENVRLLSRHKTCIRIKKVNSNNNQLQIQLAIDIHRSMAQTITVDLEVSSGNLLYLFTIRLGTKGFRLLNVDNKSHFKKVVDSLLYLIGFFGIITFAIKLGGSVWTLYKEVKLMLGYLKRDQDKKKFHKRIDNAKKAVIKLFDGLGKKVIRILSSISSLDKVLSLFIKIGKKSKLRKKNKKLQIFAIDNRLTEERIRKRNFNNEQLRVIKPQIHEHVTSQQGVIKQLYIDRRFQELTEKVRQDQSYQEDLQDKWWLLKSICRRQKFYQNDSADLNEIQAMQTKLNRPPRKKTLQVSKKQSDASEVTQSVMTNRLLPKTKTKKGSKERAPRRTRKIPLILNKLGFKNQSLLSQIGNKFERVNITFQGNPFYNSTKVQGLENSMIESLGESETESDLSINSLRQDLLHRENSVYWSMLHKKGIQQKKKQFKMPSTSKGEILWPTFVFSVKGQSLFNQFLFEFQTRNKDFDYEVSESNEKESSKRVGKYLTGRNEHRFEG